MDKEQLKHQLRELGIFTGMNLIVHSSLKSLGHVEGGADTVVDALMDVLTPDGTLVMPSFNQSRCYRKGEIFDTASTPTINGAIPESFRLHTGVLRSENPTHAFAAWGSNAERYTAEHRLHSPLGFDSPIYRLMVDGGYCLLIGVDYSKNTFHHCVELCEHVPCLKEYGEAYEMKLSDGTVRSVTTWSWRNGDCPVNDFGLYGESVGSIEKTGFIGEAFCRLFRLKDAYPVIAQYMKPFCAACGIRPRVNEHSI